MARRKAHVALCGQPLGPGHPELATVLHLNGDVWMRSTVQWRNDSVSPPLVTLDGLGSGWAALPRAEGRIVTSLDPAAPNATSGRAANVTVLECGAKLRPQAPPSTWHPLNSTGAIHTLRTVTAVHMY